MTSPQGSDPKKGLMGAAKQPNPEEVNEFHRYDDLDDSPFSHHHTLGREPNQASPGNHSHDGKDSPPISGVNLTYTVPVGTVVPFAGSATPANWLLCNGQVLQRTEYPDLFAIINVAYGSNGPTDFKLPDLTTRFPVGVGTLSPLASVGGAWDHTHAPATANKTVDLAHTHTTDLPSHTHTYDRTTVAGGTQTSTPTGGHDPAATTSSQPTPNSKSVTVNEYTGTANPPYISLNYIIKF